MFDAIVGVPVAGASMIQPRGFPADASAIAELAYYVRVVPDDEFVSEGLERFVRATEAAKIVASGGHYRDDSRERVSHPDACLPSWMTAGEIASALESAGIAAETLGMDWQLTLDVLHAIEADFEEEARLVFWFES